MDEKFPTNTPKLYVMSALEHKYINKNTLEIDYSQFYSWNSNSKVVDILNRAEQYFNTDSPFASYSLNLFNQLRKEQDKMKGMLIKVPEEAFINLVSLNVEHFFNQLSENEKKEISDMEKCGEYLKRTAEY